MEADDSLELDSASQQHIAELTPDQRRYVRLYFRPRAPTQYHNEGVRPEGKYGYDAKMPVPVFFLFSNELLCKQGVRFSRGRLNPGEPTGQSAEFLESIPFKDVYHDSGVGPLGAHRRSVILHARHAEVLVKDELSLDNLRMVVCRSEPERETLLNLLTRIIHEP